jgi:hypothetical protein
MPCTICESNNHNKRTCRRLQQARLILTSGDLFKREETADAGHTRWFYWRAARYYAAYRIVRDERAAEIHSIIARALCSWRRGPYHSADKTELIERTTETLSVHYVRESICKIQRWFRSLEELPMACPCPE